MSTNIPYLSQEDYYYSGVVMSYGPASNIDPVLQSLSPSPPSWGRVGQYLRDTQRTAIFNAPGNTQDGYQTHAAVGIQPSPSQHQVRFASPISSNELSYPTALSPPGETEASLFDFDSPATPPDTTMSFGLGHYARPNQCDQWSTHAHDLQFNNMGPLPYVNPADVNHCQQPEAYEVDTDSFVLDRSRTPSWDTYPLVSTLAAAVVPSHQGRTTAGMPLRTKQESSCHYPEPPSSGISVHGNDADDEPADTASTKRKTEEDDTDYKPSSTKKLKPSGGRPKAKTGPSSTSAARKTRKTTTIPPTPSQPPYRLSNAPNKGQFLCREPGCAPKQIYTDQLSLDAHIKKKHTRPFKCVFHFAGCRSQFAAKNEWKRHVATQHLLLNYWICQEAECTRLVNGPSPIATNSLSCRVAGSGRTAASAQPRATTDEQNLPNGNIFNRKDLYTQHLRRMHMPPECKKDGGKKSASTPEWDRRLRALQDGAIRTRCALPEDMTCPAAGCDEAFHGADAWDTRMEHVARHLDPAVRGMGDCAVEFGGEGDKCLVEWAGREDVKIIEPREGGGFGSGRGHDTATGTG
ncbi:hypothetical protein B0T18DRAFT_388418 [Schizothecium vesticola]|uniref:C2H2-type domain-containing protein n=1 Tax=Schizothecium vesticola TaxID=314040 RepID=A0AA40KB14_9PEZI|nr:hypothetical protein B0T18DRAFT_388418 [Schizothecium vesticola]